MKQLTNKQSIILEFIGEYSHKKGFPPTLREIGLGTKIFNISAVRGHISAIERKGYITKEADKARSIRIVYNPSVFSKIKRQLHDFACTDKGVIHRIVYGLALVTRKKREYFLEDRIKWIDEALEKETIEHGWKLIRKNINPDHIIIVIEVWANHSPEQVVSRIRQAGNMVRLKYLKHFPGRSLWAKGYVATTELESLEEMTGQLLENTLKEK